MVYGQGVTLNPFLVSWHAQQLQRGSVLTLCSIGWVQLRAVGGEDHPEVCGDLPEGCVVETGLYKSGDTLDFSWDCHFPSPDLFGTCVHALSHFSCLTLCDSMDCSLQASLSWGFSRQEYWSRLPCPRPEDLPDPGTEPASLISPASTGRFFTSSATWEALGTHSFVLMTH